MKVFITRFLITICYRHIYFLIVLSIMAGEISFSGRYRENASYYLCPRAWKLFSDYKSSKDYT